MMRPMNLFLIGYRCTGKTTVGQALARRLGWTFVDTDEVVVEAAGTTIARMVEIHGWPYFRERERQALAAVAAGSGQVVATGGGVVLDDYNIAAMQQAGKVIWLTAGEETIERRMLDDDATDNSRPSLTDQGRIVEIRQVLAERRPRYEKAADMTIATDHASIAQICDRIVKGLRECATAAATNPINPINPTN
jgi:shikimate kinase